jgi:uncharacterized protein YbaP (TraB family)
MHLDLPRVTRLPPPAALAFAKSRVLVMEVVMDDAANAVYRNRMVQPPGGALDSWLPAGLLERYVQLAAGYGVDRALALRLTPWAAMNLVGRPKPTTGEVLDQVLYNRARAMGKPVVGLETMDELVDALGGLPASDQQAMLVDTLCSQPRIMDQVGEQLELYAEGDLAGLVAFNSRDHADEALFERFMERLLYQRNERMVERMLPEMERGNAFVAVGALHLPGDRGVLELLERRGYTITAEF